MNKSTIFTCLCIAALGGCSSDYTPAADANGEAIFQAACAECHGPDEDMPANMFFTLDQKNANRTFIVHKVHGGGVTMPKFPNIQGRKLDLLAEYVLNHSLRK